MATGGAGGGGFNFRLARAYVEIDVDLSRFTAGLAAVQSRLNGLGARLAGSFSGLRVSSGYLSYTAAGLDRVARSALGAARAVIEVGRALAGVGIGAGRGLFASVLFSGNVFRDFARAAGLAFASVRAGMANTVLYLSAAAMHVRQGFSRAFSTLAATPLGQVFQKAFSLAAAYALDFAEDVADVFLFVGQKAGQVFSGIARVARAGFYTAAGYAVAFAADVVDTFTALGQGLWRALGPTLQGVILRTAAGVSALGKALVAALGGNWSAALARLQAAAYQMGQAFLLVWKALPPALATALAQAAGLVAAWSKSVAGFVANVALAFSQTRLGAGLVNFGKLILASIPGAVVAMQQLGRQLQLAWSAVRAALAKGIGPMFSGLIGALGPIFKQAFATLGPALVAGIGAAFGALGRAGGAVASAFGSMARTAWSAFDRVAAVVEQTFLKVARGIGSALTRVASGFGRALSGVGSVLGATLLGGGLAAGAVGVVGGLLGRAAARLESRQVAIQRVTGLDPKGAQALTESIRRMSVDLAGLPMEKLFGIAEMGARLGIEGPHLELFTRDMARVGQVLADIPIDEATTRIARLLAVFQQGPEAAIRLASALNRLDMASTASARDILDITSRLSGPASFLGMKPQQALALATALREAGVPLETGGTAMTQIMTRMASRKDSAKFARTAGMTTGQFEATLGTDPLRAIKAFEEGLARVDRLQGPIAAVRVLDELHLDGQRVRGTLLQLGRVMEQLNTYEALAAEEWQNTSSIMGGAAKVTQTLAAQWTRLGNTFRMAVQDLAMSLMPLFKGAVEGGRMLVEDIDAAIRGSGDFVKGWAQWGGNLLKTLGMAVREWGTFVGLAKDFLGLQWARLADIFGNIGTRFQQIFKFEKENIFVQVGQFFNTLMDWVVKWGGKAFSYIHDKFFKLIDYMMDKLKSLADYLVDSLTVAFSKVPLLRAFFSEKEVEAARKRTAGGPAVAILKAAGVAVPTPDEPFPARPERAGPPADPWRNLGEVFRLGPDVGKGHQAGIAAGLKALTQAMNFRQFVERVGAIRQDIRDRIARRAMEAVTGRRFAGALPGDEEGGEAVGEAGGVGPAGARPPSARDLARDRHREAIRAIQRRSAIPLVHDLDTKEAKRIRAARAAFLRRQALTRRATAFLLTGVVPAERAGAVRRRIEAAHAARGGMSPIQARIARARARRHAGEGASVVATGIRAMQQGLVRLGTFLTPEMRAKAAQEAQKQRDQKSAADAIAAALGIPSGDFYQRIGLAVAQAVKGLGVLQ